MVSDNLDPAKCRGGENLLWRFELWRSCTGYRNTTKIRYNSTGYCVEYCNWILWYPKPQIWAQWTACACCRATDVDLHVLLVPQQIYRRYRTPKNSRQRRTFDSLKLYCSLLLRRTKHTSQNIKNSGVPRFQDLPSWTVGDQARVPKDSLLPR